ncbi:MAG: heavy-metal-associated domain-containing protein [Candidatus Limnocylindria bacterium]
MITEKLKIKGMHCGSCAMNIDDGLEDLEGIAEAKTSFRKEITEVSFDESRVDVDGIRQTIRALGYEAERA